MTDSELNEIFRRLDRLESVEAIRRIVSDYAIACDEHDMSKLMNLFTEDAAFDSPNGAMVADGKSAIESMFIETFKIRGPGYHWTHDVAIDVDPDDPNRASGLVLSHAETTPGGTGSLAAMRYNDTYRREADGQWRFEKRIISFFYYVPVSEYPTALNALERVVVGGEKIPADYPEQLDVWQSFNRENGGISA